jgi:hypothetical protein
VTSMVGICQEGIGDPRDFFAEALGGQRSQPSPRFFHLA